MAKRIHVRPGKTQSKFGFAIGLIFCAIGVFIAIPMAGPFGILWTAVAVFITFSNYKNGFTKEGIDSHVIEIDENGDDVTITKHSGLGYRSFAYETEETEKRTDGNDIEERLKSLQSLYDQRLITKEEYEEKKQEILKEL